MKKVRGRVLNVKNVALMRVMAEQGKSVAEIARRIGSAEGSVRTWASRLKIQLKSNRVFYDETIADMRAVARSGKSALQVANKIGSTVGSVRVMASRHRIRFRRSKVDR